jgi:hypothetical protein
MAGNIAGQAQDTQVVSLKDAARALGISESGVRKRLAKGKLRGEKSETGQWTSVMLPPGTTVPEAGQEFHENKHDDAEIILMREIISEKDRLVKSQEQEIDFLRQQLTNRDLLYGESLRQMKALLPPEGDRPEKKNKRFLGFLWSVPED